MNKIICIAIMIICAGCGQYGVIREAELDNCCRCLSDRTTVVDDINKMCIQVPTLEGDPPPKFLSGTTFVEEHQRANAFCEDKLNDGEDISVFQHCLREECADECWFLPAKDGKGQGRVGQ